MKTPETINSRSWAREARRHCRVREGLWGGSYINAWTHTIDGLGWIQARPCYVWDRVPYDIANPRSNNRFPHLTGGWVIKVQPRDPEYMKSRPITKTFHVAGPVDLDKLSRAMARAEVYLRTERQKIAQRETLKRLVDGKVVPRNVRIMAEKRGLPMGYTDMTPQDCLAWLELAGKWRNKPEVQA